MIFVEKGVLKNEDMLKKGGLKELLRVRKKGVLRAARPRTPFQGEYPPRDLTTVPSVRFSVKTHLTKCHDHCDVLHDVN